MEASSVLGSGNTKKYDLPLSHLDFGYIEKCEDVKMLEKIYKVLKSGDEGCYPQLERFCEEKILKLNPSSRALRKDVPVASRKDLDHDQREELDTDIKNFTDCMKNMEQQLNDLNTAVVDGEMESDLPPVRSGNITLTADGAKGEKSNPKPSNKRVTPRNYKEWDKIDVDKELEKIDDTDTSTTAKDKTVIGNRVVKDIPTEIDTKGLTENEKFLKANREKDKGNEAFRANDFKEAITYYSRSISLQPTAASYNNRALAYLKNTDWHKAVSDCNIVLSLEKENVKALLRRGTAYKGLKQHGKASQDFNTVLQMEPNNKRAKELLEEIEKIIQKEKEERKTKGRRMKIEDVDEIEEEAEEKESLPPKPDGKAEDKPKSRKMKIEEVESEEEDEEDAPKINGDISKDLDTKGNDQPLVNGIVDNNHDIDEKTAVTESGENVEVIDKTNENISKEKTAVEDFSDKVTNTIQGDSESNEDSNCKDTGQETEERVEQSVTESLTESKMMTENSGPPLCRPVFYMKEYPANCKTIKEEATRLFKSGQYGDASTEYTKIIKLLEKVPDQVVNLSLMLSNRAACHLKIGDLAGCVKDCNSSLDLVPHSVKPLLRRATAYEHLERPKKAYVDYKHVLFLDSRAEQAHLGVKRCQTLIQQLEGASWRGKVHLTKVSPWDIPDIIGLDGKSTSHSSPIPGRPAGTPSSHSTSPATSQTQEKQSVEKQIGSQAVEENKHVTEKVNKEPVKTNVQKKPEMSAKEKFDSMKAKGNEHVKNSDFHAAIQCYTECTELCPTEAVSYTNRALCYIRVNQPEQAEVDCSKALDMEKDNVKALFRRAQSRKMLKRYREGIEDLKHLLTMDPKNTAAKKEMEVLKNYWREELQNMKNNLPSGKPESSKEESKPCPRSAQTGAGKQRKKMVIEEVDSDEEAKENGKAKQKLSEKKKKVDSSSDKTTKQSSKKSSQTVPEKSSQPVQSKSDTTSKPVKSEKDSKPVKAKADTSSKPVNKKSQIRETSSGLPQVPKTTPKLDKATPYEFVSAWNALKKSDTVKPYYELLKQIKPTDIKTVISNKLDGTMLNVIIKCVANHYITNGEENESYQILKNLSGVPRFSTVTMFMSADDKSEVGAVMEKLEQHKSTVYTTDDIKKLRKDYSV